MLSERSPLPPKLPLDSSVEAWQLLQAHLPPSLPAIPWPLKKLEEQLLISFQERDWGMNGAANNRPQLLAAGPLPQPQPQRWLLALLLNSSFPPPARFPQVSSGFFLNSMKPQRLRDTSPCLKHPFLHLPPHGEAPKTPIIFSSPSLCTPHSFCTGSPPLADKLLLIC